MFIGREKELRDISRVVGQDGSDIIVIYGRRRIGKSALIEQGLQGLPALFFEGLEDCRKAEQIKNFLFQLSIQTKKKYSLCKTWSEALFFLYEEIKIRPAHIVFDEFQWMANYQSGIVSELKMIWDQYLSRVSGTSLFLCGSIASFMVKKVLHSKALYGRNSLTIHLKGLLLPDIRKLLPRQGIDEVLRAFLYVGGIPKYWEILQNDSSVEVAIGRHGFSENGYFVHEYDRIFTSHFGKNKNYKKIIEVLAEHPQGMFRRDIAKQTSIPVGGQLTETLYNLDVAGFISTDHPVHLEENSRTLKYRLHDPYLWTYLKLIKPNISQFTGAGKQDVFSRIHQTGVYYNWQGHAFEYLCMEHASKIASLLGFSGVDYRCGPYFESHRKGDSGIQIDLVFNRADNVISLCEMKYSNSPVGKEVIPEVDKRAKYLQKKFPKKTIQRVLITKEPVRDSLINENYFYRIIEAEELLSV